MIVLTPKFTLVLDCLRRIFKKYNDYSMGKNIQMKFAERNNIHFCDQSSYMTIISFLSFVCIVRRLFFYGYGI